MPVAPKRKVVTQPARVDPYRNTTVVKRKNFAKNWDELKSAAVSVGYPVKLKNVAGSSVGLGTIPNADRLKALEQQIRDALEKHSSGLQVLSAK